jgi:hypothetical protein
VDWCASAGEGTGEGSVAGVGTVDGILGGMEHEQEDNFSHRWRKVPL